MLRLISSLWLRMAFLFAPVQVLLNGNFWETFRGKFGDFNNQSVLDLACGTGDLRNTINPREYLGLDMNDAYISHAQRRFANVKGEFKIQDIIKYQPDKNFDTVFLVGSSHHLSDKQLKDLFQTLKKSKVKSFILADGYPIGMFAQILWWLDDVLGGGEYFRDLEELKKLLQGPFEIKEAGVLYAKNSCYKYPYIISSAR